MTKALPRKAILIVNAMSRKGDDRFEEVRVKLTAAGIELIDHIAVTDTDGFDEIVAGAIRRAPLVIIGGGDGSLSSNVGHFIGKKTVFEIVPLGTANSFAKSLGIGDDLDSAIDVIANGVPMRIDLGRIDDHYFANAAALGLSPLIADTVPHNLKKYLGMVGYLLWAMRVAVRFRPFRLILTTADGQRHRVWATEARIANGTHHGGVELVEDADVQSGEIVVQAVTGKSLWGLAWSWFTTLFKLSAKEQTVTEWHGSDMMLDTRPRQKISIDGEILAKTPVTITCRAGAVTIAAPTPAQRIAC